MAQILRFRWRKCIAIFLLLFSLLILAGFFLAPRFIKSFLEKKASEFLHRPVTVERVRVNPCTLSFTLNGLSISEPQEKSLFFSFRELQADLDILSFFRIRPIIKRVRCEDPYIHIVRLDEYKYNFSDLLVPKDPDAKPLRFFVGNISLKNGKVLFEDLPKRVRHELTSLQLSLPFISNFPRVIETSIVPSFSCLVNGSPFVMEGKTKPFADSLETSLDFNLTKIDIARYCTYLPFPLRVVIDSGFLGIEGSISYFQRKKEPSTLLIKGSLEMKDLALSSRSKERLFSMSALDITLDGYDPFSKILKIHDIHCIAPELFLRKNKEGTLEMTALFVSEKKAVPREKKESLPSSFFWEMTALKLEQGKIHFFDDSLSQPFALSLKDFLISAKDLSNMKGEEGTVSISSSSDSGERLKLSGAIAFSPFFSQGDLLLEGASLTKYLPYYAEKILFEVHGGSLSLSSQYLLEQKANSPFHCAFSDASLTLSSLECAKAGDSRFLSLPLVQASKAAIDLSAKECSIGAISIAKGVFDCTRGKNGTLTFLPLFPVKESVGDSPSSFSTKEKGSGWSSVIHALRADNLTLQMRDTMPEDPVQIFLDQVTLSASHILFGRDEKVPFSLSFLLNRESPCSLNGSLHLNPFSFFGTLNAKNVQVTPFQSYFSEKLDLLVTKGDLSTKGEISFRKGSGQTPFFSFTGDAVVKDFSSVEKGYGEQFLSWKTFALTMISAGTGKDPLSVEEVMVENLYAGIIVHPDKTINLKNIVKSSSPSSSVEKAPDKAKKPIEDDSGKFLIKKILFKGGKIILLDKSVEPGYGVSMDKFNGSITGITTLAQKPAQVDIEAKIEGQSPLVIAGEFKPSPFYLDLTMNVDGFDMTPASPYTQRYVGYVTRKGLLSLDLNYRIDRRKLDSKNSIRLDQFTLGDKIESPLAVKIPVKFAVALLRDPSGKISLDLPVSGSLDDPKFRVGPIIVKVLLNLLAKAVASPFALIGALFGGGEELSYLSFDYGSYNLSEDGRKKLDVLVKALKERPSLSLEMQGRADPEKDSESLKDLFFLRKIKSEKLKILVQQGETVPLVDEILISEDEYPQYLLRAYQNANFSKPRTILGVLKPLPDSEMEELIRTHTLVTQDDLRFLAIERTIKTKEYLLQSGIEQERLFLLDPKILSREKEEALSLARVSFILK